MKRFFLSVCVLLAPLYAELDVQQIETMVKKIQGKREGKIAVDFLKVPTPFVLVVAQDENRTSERKERILQPQSVSFSLDAIINQRAFLNGSWRKQGESVAGYRIERIEPEEVLLKKGNHEIRLFLPPRKKRNILQISEG